MGDNSTLEATAAALWGWLVPAGWSVITGRRSAGDQFGGAILPYLGTTFSTAATLSQLDLMVARPDSEVPLIVEILARPTPPDRILGIATNVLMADGIRYRDANYSIVDTQLLIGGVVADQGPARLRLSALEDRLNWAATAFAKQGRPRLAGVRIVTADDAGKLPDLILSEAKALVTLPKRR